MVAPSASSLVAIYSLLTGILMIGFWVFALLRKLVPPEEKPWSITFHVFAEVSTAFLLIVSGAGLWVGNDLARTLSPVALGLLLYAVINSPGYYAQRNNLPMVAMFGVLITLTVVAIALLFKFP